MDRVTKPRHISDYIKNLLQSWNRQEPLFGSNHQCNQAIVLKQSDVTEVQYVEN